MQTTSANIIASTLFAGVIAGQPVVAQDARAYPFSAMVGAACAPTLEGSDRSRALALFDLNASFAGGRYFVGTQGIGFAPVLTDELTVKVAPGYGGGRGRVERSDPSGRTGGYRR
jgi:hypothetical protein